MSDLQAATQRKGEAVNNTSKNAARTGKKSKVVKPERRRQRPSRGIKRSRVGGVFTEEGDMDFFKGLELSFNMALELYAAIVAHSRVILAIKAKDSGSELRQIHEEKLKILLGRRIKMPSIEEFAENFRMEELTNMHENLVAGLIRHIDSFSRGYGDAVRSGLLRAKTREFYKNSHGKDIYHPNRPRFIQQDGWTMVENPDAIVTGSKNMLNQIASEQFSLGNESCVRRMLKPQNIKTRFYLDEIEPRIREIRSGSSAPSKAAQSKHGPQV